jgi:hypothetical protein
VHLQQKYTRQIIDVVTPVFLLQLAIFRERQPQKLEAIFVPPSWIRSKVFAPPVGMLVIITRCPALLVLLEG